MVERQPSKLNVRGSNPLFRSREISSAVECLVYTEVVTGSIPVSPIQVQKMLRVRCKECNTELTSSSKVQFCGCPNQMRVVDDKVGAVDLNQVVMLDSYKKDQSKNVLSQSDLAYQEARRSRKVRKLDFEVR